MCRAELGSVLLVGVLVGLAAVCGLILLVLPGIYIAIRLAVSTQALVVEGRRPTQAMGHLWALVGGHWWHAFGTLVLAGLAHRPGQRGDHRAVQQHQLARPGHCRRVGDRSDVAVWRAGRRAAVSGSERPQGAPELGDLRADLQGSAL
jgi:hypothetical protein